MKRLFSIRSAPFLGILGMALFLMSSNNPFPYNIYPSLIIIVYSTIMEIVAYIVQYQRKIKLITIWLFALIVPPVWNACGIAWFYGEKPPIASYDVLLPFLWIFITVISYIYSISVALIETFQRKN